MFVDRNISRLGLWEGSEMNVPIFRKIRIFVEILYLTVSNGRSLNIPPCTIFAPKAKTIGRM